MSEEKERILELLLSGDFENEEEDPGVDYAQRYREETGRDLETGEIVVQ